MAKGTGSDPKTSLPPKGTRWPPAHPEPRSADSRLLPAERRAEERTHHSRRPPRPKMYHQLSRINTLQFHPESAALAHFRFQAPLASHPFGRLAHYGQADPCALILVTSVDTLTHREEVPFRLFL